MILYKSNMSQAVFLKQRTPPIFRMSGGVLQMKKMTFKGMGATHPHQFQKFNNARRRNKNPRQPSHQAGRRGHFLRES